MREPFRDPVIADGECTRYRGTVGGRPAGHGTSRVEHDGDRVYRHRIDFTFLDEATMSVVMGFRRHEGWLLAESYRAAPSHRLVRFSFPSGPFPWNPRALVEATDLDAAQ